MTSGNPFAGNPHADVLGHTPTETEEIARLLAEVKARGKGAFGQKDMPNAEKLYNKAIELAAALKAPEAPLFSNRSAARLNLRMYEGALEDGKEAAKVDPNFVKAYYRQGEALRRMERFDDAVQAYTVGLEKEPTNKAFIDAIAATVKEQEEDRKAKEEARKPAEVDMSWLKKSVEKQDAVREARNQDGGEENLEFKGYKKLADGRTTSYFHTEISEEAKKLIGDRKPVKLDTPVQETAGAGGSSTWNQAGTYEEKGMKVWVTDKLVELLNYIDTLTPPGCPFAVTLKAPDVKGEASIATSRGKRRRVFDLSITIGFAVTFPEGEAVGNLVIPELVSDEGDTFEIKVEVDPITPNESRGPIREYIESRNSGLQPWIQSRLQQFVKEYSEQ
eukprot:CAMPEP_0204270960 /NCGR_PEP_ID=MMETSP0468-20130131/19190_1 /ASSEMBLY_ACC=CAM_ASM_000383 /TAXON_ID=2969 /ORGANISM="Oxyrrhis marina" /LENGTH=389 /DNA_ID=CAMNT_0051246559 /DNA_START=34 /DNA_END=1203 /DNA_ORIENTATION=-